VPVSVEVASRGIFRAKFAATRSAGFKLVTSPSRDTSSAICTDLSLAGLYKHIHIYVYSYVPLILTHLLCSEASSYALLHQAKTPRITTDQSMYRPTASICRTRLPTDAICMQDHARASTHTPIRIHVPTLVDGFNLLDHSV
jgi:hypothetical protein